MDLEDSEKLEVLNKLEIKFYPLDIDHAKDYRELIDSVAKDIFETHNSMRLKSTSSLWLKSPL